MPTDEQKKAASFSYEALYDQLSGIAPSLVSQLITKLQQDFLSTVPPQQIVLNVYITLDQSVHNNQKVIGSNNAVAGVNSSATSGL